MNDLRCNACHRLLARMQGEAIIAVKCPRCKTLNQFNSATSVKPEKPSTSILEHACVAK